MCLWGNRVFVAMLIARENDSGIQKSNKYGALIASMVERYKKNILVV